MLLNSSLRHVSVGRAGSASEPSNITSAEFGGLSRVERQRRVYAVLADELQERVHALSLTALTPNESSPTR